MLFEHSIGSTSNPALSPQALSFYAPTASVMEMRLSNCYFQVEKMGG